MYEYVHIYKKLLHSILYPWYTIEGKKYTPFMIIQSGA